MPKSRSAESGVRCPHCGGDDFRVVNVRNMRGYKRRRYACNAPGCQKIENRDNGGNLLSMGQRWNTYEFFSPARGVITLPRDTRAIRSTRAIESSL